MISHHRTPGVMSCGCRTTCHAPTEGFSSARRRSQSERAPGRTDPSMGHVKRTRSRGYQRLPPPLGLPGPGGPPPPTRASEALRPHTGRQAGGPGRQASGSSWGGHGAQNKKKTENWQMEKDYICKWSVEHVVLTKLENLCVAQGAEEVQPVRCKPMTVDRS